MTVVDEHDGAPLQAARRRRHPRIDGQADLGALTLRQRHAFRGEAGGKGGRGRCGLHVDEMVGIGSDQDLHQLATTDNHAVGRQGIEDLVGEDDADDRLTGGAWIDQHVQVAEGTETLGQGLEAPRFDLDRVIAKDACESRPVELEALEDRQREGPGAGAELAQDERIRPSQALPDLLQSTRDGGSEDRMGLWRGQEVARSTRTSVRSPVIAAGRVVERQLHEARERDRPVSLDLVVDARHELVLLADGVEIRTGVTAHARVQLHAGLGRRRGPSRSLMPGPTSE